MQPTDRQLHHPYNASILCRLLEHQERSGATRNAEATKKICPIAWRITQLARIGAASANGSGDQWEGVGMILSRRFLP